MNRITLHSVLPDIFQSKEELSSEIWLQETTFQKGEYYLLEAASGTGKSSLCSFLYGYRKDYSGGICFDEQNIHHFSGEEWNLLRRNSLSLLFQDLRLFPELTAQENVWLKNNLTGFKSREWIESAFQRLGISDKQTEPAGKLSFGQQQRVAVIRALCQPLDFILLDEPVSHLDNDNSETMVQLLLEEARRQGAGILVTSIGKHPHIPYHKTLRL
ncbi:MAG: ATP-binding cassette domain-containing protein [Odoribacter splanchnicus]|nr:ATP-binding cassette domain-containing protein [Odoribacter splanchnicus]